MRHSLCEKIDDFAYYVNINELKDIYNEGEFIDILFDEYLLDAEFFDKDVVKVYAYNNDSLYKLEECLKKYGAKTDYINDVVNKVEVYENKNYINNMRKSFDRVMQRRLNESRDRRTFNNRRIFENYKVNMFGDFDPIFEAEEVDDKCSCKYKGKLVSKMDKAEKRSAKEEIRAEISELKKQIKERQKAGKTVKALEMKLERLQHTLNCLMGRCEAANESVYSSFRRRGRLFESEDVDVSEANETEEADETEKPEVTDADTEQNDDKSEYEDVEMKAVVLTVLNKNIDSVKSAMVEAGVSEDDINVDEVDSDAADDDQVDIRVDVNSIDALIKYLESVGINLEDELGGEVISTDDEDVEDDTDNAETDDTDDAADDFNQDEFDDLFSDK